MTATSYGVGARRVVGLEALRDALGTAIEADVPRLVEVSVTPGMSLF